LAIATLTAQDRSSTAKQVRNEGFTPAVVYGFGYEEGRPIQFNSSKLLATIKKHGANARLNVEINGESEYGAIKEVQLHPVTNEIRHIDIQVFNRDDVVRLTVPIRFVGMEELVAKRYVAATLISEIDITGPAIEIPQSLTVDLTEKEPGESVTIADLGIDEELRVEAELTDTVVTITEAEEEPEETEDVGEVDVEVELVSDSDEETEEDEE